MKTPLEFSIFLLYPWKFQTKQSSTTPGYSTKIVFDRFQGKAKNKDPWKFHIIFSWLPFGNSTSFLVNPRKSHMLFLWYPCKFHILNTNPPPAWIFSAGIVAANSMTLSYTRLVYRHYRSQQVYRHYRSSYVIKCTRANEICQLLPAIARWLSMKL